MAQDPVLGLIDERIRALELRIEPLQDELDKLQTLRRDVRSLLESEEKKSNQVIVGKIPSENSHELIANRPTSLSEAVRMSIRTPRETREAVAWVKELYDPEAKSHSIRALLSALKKKGDSTLDETTRKWALKV